MIIFTNGPKWVVVVERGDAIININKRETWSIAGFNWRVIKQDVEN
jgi:hypothetical protein